MKGIDGKNLVEVENTSTDKSIIRVLEEVRSDDWWITYYVRDNSVEVVESMGDNPEHCKSYTKNIEETIALASSWC